MHGGNDSVSALTPLYWDFSRAPIFNILLGLFPIFNIFQAPFLNISIFFLRVISQKLMSSGKINLTSIHNQMNVRFKKSLGGRGGASAPCHGTTHAHAHAEGTPRVSALSVLVALRGSSPRCRRSWPGAPGRARIRKYTIFLWTLDSIFNIPI